MAKKMRDRDGQIFCSNCAETVEEKSESCDECDEFFDEDIDDVRICPACGCPLESEEEYEVFKENILGKKIEIDEIQWILSVLDKMLEDLPEEKIEELSQLLQIEYGWAVIVAGGILLLAAAVKSSN